MGVLRNMGQITFTDELDNTNPRKELFPTFTYPSLKQVFPFFETKSREYCSFK